MKTGGKCLPRAHKKPRYVIPTNKLEEYNSYMKDHALISKFVGYWPTEKELYRWIYQRWKPKGRVELKLGEKGFFTTIFANLGDKEKVFEEGPYFMNNAGLLMKYWEERYNPDNEKMLEAPIWVRLFRLPVEFWDPEILEGIGNTISAFVKQPLDYEHIPFRCRRCHEYGHLYRQCPLNKEEEYTRKKQEQHREAERTEEKDKGFQQVTRNKKASKEGIRTQTQTKSSNIESQNKFKILQENSEEDEDKVVEEEDPKNEPMEIITETREKGTGLRETNEEETTEKIEILTNQTDMETESQKENKAEEERIMRQLIQEWKNLDERFIPDRQKQIYKEAFQKYKERNGENMDKQDTTSGEQEKGQMGIGGPGKSSRKKGRKTMNETIQTVGEILINSAGGIAILWNPNEIIFESWTSMTRILTGTGRIAGTKERVTISGVYGPHTSGDRENFIKNLQATRRLHPETAWIVGGYFNVIRSLKEKKGGIRKTDQYMEIFNDMIDGLRLVDLPTINGVYTWNNRRGGKNQIASRLDRFLVSEMIMNRDVFIEAKIMPSLGSDPWSIRLEVDIKANLGKKPFRFEAFWLRHPEFLEKMEEWWTQSTVQGKGKMHTFQLKLKELKGRIKKWNKEEFGNIMEEKQKLEEEMEALQQRIINEGRTEESSQKEGIILGKLEERRKQEEVLWRQKSRIKWLREGERNTRFFQQAMIHHRQRNRIFSIKNEGGERIVEQEGIEKVLMEYHKGILTESLMGRFEAIKEVCTAIPRIVTEDQNRALMRAASLEEVEEVVMSMKKGTAPGPDGFTVDFYQAGWHFMGKEILELIEESRINQKVWPALNSTFFSLIPKNDNSEDAKGFRPIALCNVIYKIIASLMAKRLKPLLDSLISPEQTGFVEDLSKAYDRINWQYLEEILGSFGFGNRWIKWVHSLISTPNFSILVNGTPSKTFKASRGIRQGDPISPFLFILAAEGLGRYLKKERATNNIKGLRLWGNELPITHQQFVDDIMLFGEPTVKEVRNLKKVLDLFAKASWMEINKEKSCTFIFNTMEAVKSHLTRMLGFKQGELPTKYLGNVLDFNSKRLKNWQGVLEKLKNRVANWTFRTLNIAGRIVLVKSMLQAIPIYPLSIMAVPQGVCSKIGEILRKFIYGGSFQQKKWALVSWKHLTKRKEEGGLGLRDPDKLNKVLDAKLWWRWLRGGNDLWKQLWRHKYNMLDSTEDIYRMQETPKGSAIWDLASQNRDIVEKNVSWEIRGGGEAKFWDENWQQRGKMSRIQKIQNIQDKIGDNHIYVKDYWKEDELDGIWWKWTTPEEWGIEIDQEQQEAFMEEVESMKVKARTGRDILRWGKSMKGSFTVKEAYYLANQHEITEGNQDWKVIWGKNWWPKITLFAWLVAKDKILTWDKLQKKGFSGPSRCYLCNREAETQDHLLIKCVYAKNLWREAGKLFQKPERSPK
eukprot:PITA_03838